ncbi:uncharacterized protein LOC123561804 [Mercenaria mercenaria]|uniref:uncharacterized protein LOC123561804 n=1 Tax=Mercenaria mercenaria TaxID=6596 RepID=UPI001E1D5FB3|nr:uncharacterized protein LOC123561804 [Mercenaria mercenaria]
MATRRLIEDKIDSKKVMVFSKSYCPYCAKAKKVFENLKLSPEEYEVWEIDKESNCNEIQTILGNKTGKTSVPRVFINGKFFGGGDDVVMAAQKGTLRGIIDQNVPKAQQYQHY